MELYFAPLACSLSARIALYEAGAEAVFHQVDTKAKRLAGDFLAVSAQGQVPVLKTAAGDCFTENPVVLQVIADAYPKAGLIPPSGAERYRVQQWLNFVTSELHKFVFIALLDDHAPEGAKHYARDKAVPRLDYLDAHLAGREFLTGAFSIADCYLVTILNWSGATAIDLARWSAVQAYVQRLRQRPAVAKAFAEEFALYRAEQEKRIAA